MTSFNMHRKESPHFIFHYGEGSCAQANIDAIVNSQESAFFEITELLETAPNMKINCWLCESDEQLAKLADCPPYNGYAVYESGSANIYYVYNESIDATGRHEITHIIADDYNDIQSAALAEGLAVYMDRLWWSIPNELCVKLFLENGKYISVDSMIDTFENLLDDPFYKVNSCYSYPIMGAFVGFLIEIHGIEQFMRLYAHTKTDWKNEFIRIYGNSLAILEGNFISYVEALTFPKDQIDTAQIRLQSLLH